MKILMINSVCGIRSTGRICTDLARGAMEAGWEVRVAYGRERVPEDVAGLAVRVGGRLDVYAHALRARLLDDSGRGSKRATREFIQWVEQYDPDVIHLHNIHGYYLNMQVLFSYLRRCNKRILWTLHDGWAFSGHSATCDEADCTRWKTGCHDCPLKGVYPKALVDRSRRNWQEKKRLFSGIPNLTLVCPSHWLADRVRESFLGEYPVEVVPNGIDVQAFYPQNGGMREKYGLGEQKVVLGVASVWTDSKGYADFLRLPELLDAGTWLVMAGVSPEQKEALPQGILGITRTESVRELAALYSEADLLLNLTYCDTYPTVNLESLCCGTPVLTYRTGGSPESVRQGLGAVVPRGDLEAAAREARELLRPGVKAMARERSGEMRRIFRKELAVERYLALYRSGR